MSAPGPDPIRGSGSGPLAAQPDATAPRDDVRRLAPRDGGPRRGGAPPAPAGAPAYAELVAATNFSFLRGASPAEEMLLTSLILGQAGLAVADRNTVAGVVRAWSALRDLRETGEMPPMKTRQGSGPGEILYEPRPLADRLGSDASDLDPAEAARLTGMVQGRAKRFRLISGARLVFADGTPDIVALPLTRDGWGRLCRLLTLGKSRAEKGECLIGLPDLLHLHRDMALIVRPGRDHSGLDRLLGTLADRAPGEVWLGATMPRRGDDRRRLGDLGDLADAAGVPLLATNDALYARSNLRPIQDILTCIRLGCTIQTAGRRLEPNAERHLKSPAEMGRLFLDRPDAVEETTRLLARIDFDLGDLSYDYPDEPVPPGWTAQGWLERQTWVHAGMRYPDGVPAKVERALKDELALIAQLDYAPYFLTIHEIVRVAQDRGILCQGRGSAANSAVCFVLGITSVDPATHDLLFARFVSTERREPPDIDVDFEHERREEVIQHIYERYGRDRAAIIATVIHYRPKSAIRDVGKALGLSEDVTAALAGTQWGSWGSEFPEEHIRQAGIDPTAPEIVRAVWLAHRIIGFPRHLSQHVGGFVLTRGALAGTVPLGPAAMPGRTFLEWDKDDVDALRMMKVDILALGMLSCIRRALDLLSERQGTRIGLADVPREDPETYAMLQRGDSIGVFQVESRAQMNMLPRLKPAKFYDLVVQVAIVRPGPIQGQMVHPYLRRRAGLEPFDPPSPAPPHDPNELRDILKETFGVPLFQEQAMRIAMVAAEFTPAEANQLRRAMATFRHNGTIHRFEALMVGRMVDRGYDPAFAQGCYDQIKGFGSYGFPESHAAAFAQLVYISAWIKRHHPGLFCAALLNAQPMGFYAPAQIVQDAQGHGVEVRPVDVNTSDWDCTMEEDDTPSRAVRLGMRQIEGMPEAEARRLVALRPLGGWRSVLALARVAGLTRRALHALADADAFRSIGLDRRAAMWEVRRLPTGAALPLFAAAVVPEIGAERDAALPAMRHGERVAADYQTLRLSLAGHPMGVVRPVFDAERVLTCAAANAGRDGMPVRVAGVVLVRQRPGKGNAVFITIEDETATLNAMLWARDFERMRRAVMTSRLMLILGRVQRSPEGVTMVMVQQVIDRSEVLAHLFGDDAAPDLGARDGESRPTTGTSRPVVPAPKRHGPGSRRSPDGPDTVLPKPLHLAPPSRPSVRPMSTPRHAHPRDVRIMPKSRDFH